MSEKKTVWLIQKDDSKQYVYFYRKLTCPHDFTEDNIRSLTFVDYYENIINQRELDLCIIESIHNDLKYIRLLDRTVDADKS